MTPGTEQLYECAVCGDDVAGDAAVRLQLVGPPHSALYGHVHAECGRRIEEGGLKIKLIPKENGPEPSNSNGNIS